ncbi:predicted protein, partial [Nematostella vectensis]
IGTYYEKDQEKCINCPEGSYMNHEGALECKACPDGTWTFGSHKANFTNCQVKCAPGTYSSNGVEPCTSCPIGSFQNATGGIACRPCPGRLSTHGTGADDESACVGQ